jgi:putative membrane protein
LGPTIVVVAAVGALVALDELTDWSLVVLLAVPAAALLARDRATALGHALVEGHVVARSGSLDRQRAALAVRGVIGWNLRASWFQRRAGLSTLVATTAGGHQSVTVLDVPDEAALALAYQAMPDLVGPFLVSSETNPTALGRPDL